MKNIKTYFTLILLCIGVLVTAQTSIAPFMSYQAVARNADGNLLVTQAIAVKVAFSSKDGTSKVFYEETHEVVTDNVGAFQLMMGNGSPLKGDWSTIPWAQENVFLSIYLKSSNQPAFKLVSRSQMLSVPYAFHSKTADQLLDKKAASLRNQSIYWTTSGNAGINPAAGPVQFMGTRDEKDFYIKTDSTTRAIFTKEGQLEIYSGVGLDGTDDDINDYPMTVEGSQQGIYIRVNGSRNESNNFLTFADVDGLPNNWGRVEGQTLDELYESSSYRVQRDLYILQGAGMIGKIIGLVLETAGEASSGLGAGAAVGTALTAATIIVESAALLTNSITWANDLKNNIGVSYSSGNGDYAEYLKRENLERDLLPGEVVGIRGGMVSLNTESADHFRVVSAAPIVLGNEPQAGEEALYEKVAFLGQVPVRVAGEVLPGDYILPSGNNDGLGVAIAPEEMKTGDYSRIIGVAWDSVAFSPMNIVRVAIGINNTNLGNRIEEMDQKVDRIMDFLQGKGSLADITGATTNEAGTSENEGVLNTSTLMKQMDDAEFFRLIETYEPFLKEIYTSAKEMMEEQGFDLAAYPFVKHMMDNPVPYLKEMRTNPDYISQWASIDQKILEGLNKGE